MGTSLGLFYLNTDGAVTLLARDADGNWSAEQSLGGRSVTDITAVYVPETQTVQLFYQGVSDGVYSRWRTPDGTWSDEQHIGGNPYYPGGTPGQYLCAPIAAAGVPGTEVLQLFYCGDDGSIRSMWRNPDGSWAAETNLGGSLQQGLTYITAAQVPGTYTLQLFYPSAESVLSSIWRNADGSWSAEQDLGSSNIGAVTAVPIQGNGTLQLFYPPAINNGAPLPLRSRVRNPDGSWSAELDLAAPRASAGRTLWPLSGFRVSKRSSCSTRPSRTGHSRPFGRKQTVPGLDPSPSGWRVSSGRWRRRWSLTPTPFSCSWATGTAI